MGFVECEIMAKAHSLKRVVFNSGQRPIISNGKFYIPVSMSNRRLEDRHSREEIFEWLNVNTNNVLFVIGDYLDRYNRMIFQGACESEAIESSIRDGDKYLKIIRDMGGDDSDIHLETIRTYSFYRQQQFKDRLEQYNRIFESSQPFRTKILKTAYEYLKRQNRSKLTREIAVRLCVRYLLEELVIFERLAEKGYTVNVYPGQQLPIVKEIVLGNLSFVSPILSKIDFAEMKFKPIK